MLEHLRPHLEALRVGRDHERGLAAGAELRVDRGDDHVDVGDAAVGGPCLLAVEDPLVGGLVVAGAGAQRGDVGAGVGLGHAEGADLGVLRGAVALGHPFGQLLGRAGGEDPGGGQRGAHDGHADPGVAPEQLLVDDGQRQPGGVGPELRQSLEAVEADLRRLADDRPRRLLLLVPLVRRRAHHALREPVDPVADVALVLAELEREALGGLPCRGHLADVDVGSRCGFHAVIVASIRVIVGQSSKPGVALRSACARPLGSSQSSWRPRAVRSRR